MDDALDFNHRPKEPTFADTLNERIDAALGRIGGMPRRPRSGIATLGRSTRRVGSSICARALGAITTGRIG